MPMVLYACPDKKEGYETGWGIFENSICKMSLERGIAKIRIENTSYVGTRHLV